MESRRDKAREKGRGLCNRKRNKERKTLEYRKGNNKTGRMKHGKKSRDING